MLKTNYKRHRIPENLWKPITSQVSGFLFFVGVAFTPFVFSACGNDNGPSGDGYDREVLLNEYSRWIQNEYSVLEDHLGQLKSQFDAFVTTPDSAHLEMIKAEFTASYTSWQRIDFLPIESAADEYLVESANTFPCKAELIDKNIAEEDYNLEPINQLAAQGFPAMDYLLFSLPTNETIALLTDPNTNTYFGLLVDRLQQKTSATLDGWNTNESTIIKNSGSDAGSSISLLFNAFVSKFEQRTRDAKVGIPAGIRTDNIIQPAQSEALYSGISVTLLKENVLALKDFFHASDVDGFDNYLNYLNSTHDGENLSSVIDKQFDVILAKIEILDHPMSEIVQSDREKAITLFNEMQKLVVYLKVDMASELGILINYADNDGDS